MILHFSKDSHTIISPTQSSAIWEAGMNQAKALMESDSVSLKTLAWDQVKEKRSDLSVDYTFPFAMDLDFLLNIYGITPDGDLNLPQTCEGIWISGETGEMIFYEGQTAVQLTAEASADDMALLIRQAREEDYIHYYPGVLLNDDAEFYLPITLGDVLPNVRVQSAVDVDDVASLEKIAKGFFSDNYAYARRIVESDYTTIYVQGNDTLVISEGGLVEYSDAALPMATHVDLYEALETAVRFIEDRDDIGSPVYLTGMEAENETTYRFEFSYFINDTRVILKKEMQENWNLHAPIEVRVNNNLVKSYRRILRIVDSDFQAMPQEAFGPQDVIDRNFDTIVARYQGSLRARGQAEPEDYGSAIYQAVEDVSLSYFDSPDQLVNGEMELIAIWEILIDEHAYYFDVHTGNLRDVVKREV
jgi:hypothetical protein